MQLTVLATRREQAAVRREGQRNYCGGMEVIGEILHLGSDVPDVDRSLTVPAGQPIFVCREDTCANTGDVTIQSRQDRPIFQRACPYPLGFPGGSEDQRPL